MDLKKSNMTQFNTVELIMSLLIFHRCLETESPFISAGHCNVSLGSLGQICYYPRIKDIVTQDG